MVVFHGLVRTTISVISDVAAAETPMPTSTSRSELSPRRLASA